MSVEIGLNALNQNERSILVNRDCAITFQRRQQSTTTGIQPEQNKASTTRFSADHETKADHLLPPQRTLPRKILFLKTIKLSAVAEEYCRQKPFKREGRREPTVRCR